MSPAHLNNLHDKSIFLPAPPSTILACVLSVLVQFVSPIDGQSHSSNDKYHSCTSHKESGIAGKHGYFSSKVASPNRYSLGGVALAIVVLAAQDASFCVVVSKARKLKKSVSTLVAELCIAAIAGHVITASGSLDVNSAEWAFLAVGDASIRMPLGPPGELSISLPELLAGQILMPRCMTSETPVMAAPHTCDLDVFFTNISSSSGEGMLGNVRTIGTSFLSFIIFCLQSHLLVEIPGLPRSVLEYLLSSDDTIFALWVGALNEDEPFFNICVDDGGYAGGTDRFLAARPL